MSHIRAGSVRALSSALLTSLFLSSAAGAEEAHWGYASTVGADHWGEVSNGAMCAAGAEQSPIALSTASAVHANGYTPSFHYGTSRVRMVNNGHTVQFNYDVGSTLRLGPNEYKLAQFHFHTPSEHTLDGEHFPLEVHLVHTDAAGAPKVVVGVLIEEGLVNAALFSAFRHLPRHEGEESSPVGALINASALLPFNRSFFHYAGSLTTPPCSEGLEWFVMKHPIQMSDSQIAAFERLPHINPNNRPVQPLNSRVVSAQSGH
ncbi:carbonic anhydrase family protein [Myxococcus sp. K15C18031901]|uniref:carbonic anhydrase n=1 Tax=Myxococcus dinghuensis TaxID=2906761 RepID=UPI0020A6FE86|nr:carbonic anhydrase family protein [Myxococcus dinghuensis]MCP3100201.1 carbonic anhydrase family protein [Myxococcus dinghuensis]